MCKETLKKIRIGLFVAWDVLAIALLVLIWKVNKNVQMQDMVTMFVRAYIVRVPVMIGTINWLKPKEKE